MAAARRTPRARPRGVTSESFARRIPNSGACRSRHSRDRPACSGNRGNRRAPRRRWSSNGREPCVIGVSALAVFSTLSLSPSSTSHAQPLPNCCHGRVRDLLLAGIHAAKCLLDLLLQGGTAARPALALQAPPVEFVIPRLRRIIEDAHPLGLAGRRGHDLLEGQVRELGARDQLVGGLNVGLVMLA